MLVEAKFIMQIHPSHYRSRQIIEGLDALVNLEELWLGKNKISRLEV